ncbi:MAG: serine/threonine-protein kinase [Chloroflexia bacterium]
MLTCEVCGKLHPVGTDSCDVCGTGLTALPYLAMSDLSEELGLDRLPPGSELGRVLAAPLRELTGALCPFCANTNRPGAGFCAHCGHTLVTRPPSGAQGEGVGQLDPGALLQARYRIVRRVAQGGMGAVYEAQDEQEPGTRAAVKEMAQSSLLPDERTQSLKDFMREATLLATLQHPNLPRFHAVFQENGKYYLVMEFIAGQTLEHLISNSRSFLPENRVLVWTAQLCEVLNHLHGRQPPIIYRDMKPGNIMLLDGDDRVKLIDFGIARFHRRGRNTDTAAFGTAGYSPPEQYGNGQTDERSDVYALAATLHHLLTGHDPVQNPFHWRPIRSYNPHVSREVDQAIMRALELKPEMRYPSVDAFARALGLQPMPAPAPAVPVSVQTPAPQPQSVPLQPGKPPTPPITPRGRRVPSPELELSETVINLGEIGRRARKAKQVKLWNAGAGDLKGIVHVTQPWLAVSAVQFDGNIGELSVSARSRGLRFGRLQPVVPNVFAWAGGLLRHRVLLWVLLAVLILAAGAAQDVGIRLQEALLDLVVGLFGLLLAAQVWFWLVARHVRWFVPAPLVNSGEIIIESNGGRRRIEVRLPARPPWLLCALAWLLVTVLMVGELLLAAYLAARAFGIPISIG